MKAMKLVSGLLCVLIGVNTLVADEVKLKEKQFKRCLLVEREGRVWLQEPMVYLGMVGVWDTPNFCLSAELAEELTLLVSKVVEGNRLTAGWFYTFEMPRLDKGADRFVVVWLETKMRPLEVDTSVMIVSARLRAAECVKKDWIEDWENLDAALKEVVAQSLSAPGKEKKRRLSEAIEKGSQALSEMKKVNMSEEFRAVVKKIEPEVHLVRTFKRDVTKQWQVWLERFAGRLDIKPRHPFPARPKRWPVFELVAESESPEAFRARIEQSPADSIDQVLYYDYGSVLGRNLWVWDIANLTKAKFAKVRVEAKKLLEKLGTREELLNETVDYTGSNTIQELGIVLRPASSELLAKKLILSGVLVESVSPQGKDTGLQAGDIIMDYDKHVNQVIMGWHDRRNATKMANRIRRGYKPRVMRGNEVIELGGKSKE
ncbi:MAG: hypothetical protein ACYTEQ_30570 [Planctomycetota bacterium]